MRRQASKPPTPRPPGDAPDPARPGASSLQLLGVWDELRGCGGLPAVRMGVLSSCWCEVRSPWGGLRWGTFLVATVGWAGCSPPQASAPHLYTVEKSVGMRQGWLRTAPSGGLLGMGLALTWPGPGAVGRPDLSRGHWELQGQALGGRPLLGGAPGPVYPAPHLGPGLPARGHEIRQETLGVVADHQGGGGTRAASALDRTELQSGPSQPRSRHPPRRAGPSVPGRGLQRRPGWLRRAMWETKPSPQGRGEKRGELKCPDRHEACAVIYGGRRALWPAPPPPPSPPRPGDTRGAGREASRRHPAPKLCFVSWEQSPSVCRALPARIWGDLVEPLRAPAGKCQPRRPSPSRSLNGRVSPDWPGCRAGGGGARGSLGRGQEQGGASFWRGTVFHSQTGCGISGGLAQVPLRAALGLSSAVTTPGSSLLSFPGGPAPHLWSHPDSSPCHTQTSLQPCGSAASWHVPSPGWMVPEPCPARPHPPLRGSVQPPAGVQSATGLAQPCLLLEALPALHLRTALRPMA
ncbi:uncharacterized protein LOC129145924 [Talpa occidentalis]|uniref:uncharacterized protein LOC129145924 n=1 Tax=Talpa occidentalis TaxID=50954 RepID=UPI0023F64876|nr:uncharacterized protein LOC129145924 [Talpa occidentalis]XP_054551946.1 uncharacterized protein LOC129145924 [Talpa occidentalis]XP_054551947.1 uncharacterized protein LOC129145924 [Talpa occidentalis]